MLDPDRVGWGLELSGEGGVHVIIFKNPPKVDEKMTWFQKSTIYNPGQTFLDTLHFT